MPRREGKRESTRVGIGCNGQTIFGLPTKSGNIFDRSVELGWNLFADNKYSERMQNTVFRKCHTQGTELSHYIR